MPVSDLTIAGAWAIELVRSVGPVGGATAIDPRCERGSGSWPLSCLI